MSVWILILMLESLVWKGRSELGSWEKSDRALAVQAGTISCI